MSKERKTEGHDDSRSIPIDFRGAADPSKAQPDTPEGPPDPALKPVPQEEFAKLLAEKDELAATLVRRQADFDNYRKRIERERKDDVRRGTGRLLQELLPVLDGFERALAAHPAQDDYRKGVELIYRNLADTLARQGLERIAAQGKIFDPHFHEAIERVETNEHPDGSILQVVQEGYIFDGRVLRPSLVRVAVSTHGAGGDSSAAEHSRAN